MLSLAWTLAVHLPSDVLPPPQPDTNFIGGAQLLAIYNGIYFLVLVCCGIAALIGAGIAAFGRIAKHQDNFTAGLVTFFCAVGAAALATMVAAFINFGTNLGKS